MSLYLVRCRKKPRLSLWVGWDCRLGTFFARPADAHVQGWYDSHIAVTPPQVGWRLCELPTIRSLRAAIMQYASLSKSLASALRADRAALGFVPPPAPEPNWSHSDYRRIVVPAWERYIAPHLMELAFPLAKQLAHRAFDALDLPRPFVKGVESFRAEASRVTPEWELFICDQCTNDWLFQLAAEMIVVAWDRNEGRSFAWVCAYTSLIRLWGTAPAEAVDAFVQEVADQCDSDLAARLKGPRPITPDVPVRRTLHWRNLMPGDEGYGIAIGAGCRYSSTSFKDEPLPHRDGDQSLPSRYCLYDVPVPPERRYPKYNYFRTLYPDAHEVFHAPDPVDARDHFKAFERRLSFADAKQLAFSIAEELGISRPFVKWNGYPDHVHCEAIADRWEIFLSSNTSDIRVIWLMAHLVYQPGHHVRLSYDTWLENTFLLLCDHGEVPFDNLWDWMIDAAKLLRASLTCKTRIVVDPGEEASFWMALKPGAEHYEMAVRECCSAYRKRTGEPLPRRDAAPH